MGLTLAQVRNAPCRRRLCPFHMLAGPPPSLSGFSSAPPLRGIEELSLAKPVLRIHESLFSIFNINSAFRSLSSAVLARAPSAFSLRPVATAIGCVSSQPMAPKPKTHALRGVHAGVQLGWLKCCYGSLD